MIISEENIAKYTGYFHDGAIHEIVQKEGEIIFLMESAEMALEDLQDDIPLSKYDTFLGKLYLKGGIICKQKDKLTSTKIIKTHYFLKIFDFEIKNHKVFLDLIFDDLPNSSKKEDFQVWEIEAKEIYWKNLPDLEIPE